MRETAIGKRIQYIQESLGTADKVEILTDDPYSLYKHLYKAKHRRQLDWRFNVLPDRVIIRQANWKSNQKL